MPNDLLIVNCSLISEPDAPIRRQCFVEIAAGRISSTGSMSTCPAPARYTVIDATDMLLLPGLVNAHNHCAMTLFRGLADDLELTAWLNDHIFPAEAAHVSPEMVYWCTLLAAAEMIRSGTTTVADGYFFSDQAARALHDSGMRAVVAHGIVDFPAPSVPDPSKNIETVAAFLDRWHGRSPRITPAVFAHAPYTCSPQTLRRAKELADRQGVRFFIHLAETRAEQTLIIDPQGATPLQHLAGLGILDGNCVCVHGVWLDDDDLDLLADSRAAVVTCPQSNLKLAAGIARVPDLLGRGIPVAIGTDGCASNNSLDLFREIDLLAKIMKLRPLDATALPASVALRCATASGGLVLGLPAGGTVVAGAPADLILLDLNSPHLTPFYSTDLLVYAATGSDVATVIIDGAVVMRDRQILSFDLTEVYRQVAPLAEEVRRFAASRRSAASLAG
ncbi:MAG: amidohydrolase [Desulfofustis sp.]|nr:amidohydrolase [Desulfofustis sp.]